MAKAKKEPEAEAQVHVAETAGTVPQPTPPSVDLQDLAMAINLIGIAVERGAFKPNELTTVGATHDKISVFLQFQAEQQAAAKAAADAVTGENKDG